MSRFLRGGAEEVVKFGDVYYRMGSDDANMTVEAIVNRSDVDEADVFDVDAMSSQGISNDYITRTEDAISQFSNLPENRAAIEQQLAEADAAKTAQEAKKTAAQIAAAQAYANRPAPATPAAKLPRGHKKSWSELFPAMSSDKYRYIGKDGKVKHLKDVNTPSYLGGKPFGNDIGPCGIPKGSRTWKLRAQLMKQLKTLDGESDCLGQCKEDESLDKMEKRFAKFFQKQDEKCVLSSFEKDDRLRLLAAKKEMLEHQSFAFLHSECEGDEECNPFEADIMSKTLIECCGVKDGELLFGDESMAAVGKFLSGSQKVGESPAALGHASNLYPTGLIAPGVDKSKLWINICYLVARSELDMSAAEIAQRKEGKELQAEHAYLDTKWVPANVLEQKKYTTLKGIDRAITERKRAILKVNRQILELQLQMANVHGSDHFFSGEDSDTSDFADSQRGLELYVTNSVTRAKNMLLGSEARRKMKEADEAFHLRVAHGKKGVSKATEKALAKLMGGKKPRRKKHGRRHSRRRR